MAAFDSELMALVNAVHQLGSSAAIIVSATEVRSILSVLRQIYRGNVATGVNGLRPPLPMYHAFPLSIPSTTEVPVVLGDLAVALNVLGQASDAPDQNGFRSHYFYRT